MMKDQDQNRDQDEESDRERVKDMDTKIAGGSPIKEVSLSTGQRRRTIQRSPFSEESSANCMAREKKEEKWE